MFNGTRFLTNGINIEVPFEVQFFIWNMIENMKVDEKDYLQVFELEILSNSDVIKICHRQEYPEKYINFKNIHNFGLKKNIKIYVVDECEYSTMMLSDEY